MSPIFRSLYRVMRRPSISLMSGILLAATLVSAPPAQALATTITVGKYVITLYLPRNGYYAEEESHVQFKLAEIVPSGDMPIFRPVEHAQVRCIINMPAMASMPKFDEAAHSEGIPGVYGAHPTFPHGGNYHLLVIFTPPPEPGAGPLADVQFDLLDPVKVQDADAARLKGRVRPFSLELTTIPEHPVAGKPVELRFRIIRQDQGRLAPDGQWIAQPEQVRRFETVHEKLMHFFIISRDLGHFSHEHPTPLPDGSFSLRYTFPASGEYRVFADCAPFGAGSQVIGTSLQLDGKLAEKFDLNKAKQYEAGTIAKVDDGVFLEWQLPEKPLASRTGIVLTGLVTDSNHLPITDIQPWLGAMAHMALVHEDGETFVHSHPDDSISNSGRDGKLPFLIRFPKPGLYRGWVQFQRNGKVTTTSFVFRAE